MAQDSLAKSTSKLNYYSRRHLKLYQKVLYTGNHMASMLRYYDCHIGLSEAGVDSAREWSELMEQLAEVIL